MEKLGLALLELFFGLFEPFLRSHQEGSGFNQVDEGNLVPGDCRVAIDLSLGVNGSSLLDVEVLHLLYIIVEGKLVKIGCVPGDYLIDDTSSQLSLFKFESGFLGGWEEKYLEVVQDGLQCLRGVFIGLCQLKYTEGEDVLVLDIGKIGKNLGYLLLHRVA